MLAFHFRINMSSMFHQSSLLIIFHILIICIVLHHLSTFSITVSLFHRVSSFPTVFMKLQSFSILSTCFYRFHFTISIFPHFPSCSLCSMFVHHSSIVFHIHSSSVFFHVSSLSAVPIFFMSFHHSSQLFFIPGPQPPPKKRVTNKRLPLILGNLNPCKPAHGCRKVLRIIPLVLQLTLNPLNAPSPKP